jgi:hypothetical protein
VTGPAFRLTARAGFRVLQVEQRAQLALAQAESLELDRHRQPPPGLQAERRLAVEQGRVGA